MSSFSLESREIRPFGSLQDEKESCSTWRDLRVGTGFEEFQQTLRGSGFSLLGFYALFKSYVDVSVG